MEGITDIVLLIHTNHCLSSLWVSSFSYTSVDGGVVEHSYYQASDDTSYTNYFFFILP